MTILDKSLFEQLNQLACDFWWTGDPWANDIWRDLDPVLWRQLNHNPQALLNEVDQSAVSKEWIKRANDLLQRWQDHQDKPPFSDCPKIAYFCMEFGMHESFQIYSGGLGILAGDHIRSAGDLKLDFVGVGLFYRHGYFKQIIDAGLQLAVKPDRKTLPLPTQLLRDSEGRPLIIEVPFRNQSMKLQAWSLKVGHATLYLLDSDLEENTDEMRGLCHSLYGGDINTRIGQEIALGIGGARLLHALGIKPDVYHMNEGHAAFLTLQLWADAINNGLDAAQGWKSVAEQCVFTTHTPVPAGHDRFYWDTLNAFMANFRDQMGLPKGAFMSLGRKDVHDLNTPLSMTVLALKGSRAANGVSALHGEVSREMFPHLGSHIGHITNGVHPTAWMGPELAELLTKHMPHWNEAWTRPEMWSAIDKIDDDALWEMRLKMRRRVVNAARERLGPGVLNEKMLTIGFARRFATYKRGDLIFSDPDRLEAILDQGVQLIFAGKAHPADKPGQAVLAKVNAFSRHPRFRGRVVFIPDYDAAIGRAMTQGCDVWLNNPRRPREASGTSGQKAALNGNLNLSILDGWWPEGYNGDNGWAIGDTRDWENVAEQDVFDVNTLYALLEDEVIPAFQDKKTWCRKMRSAIKSCAPVFNTHRMVQDYLNLYYRKSTEKARRSAIAAQG